MAHKISGCGSLSHKHLIMLGPPKAGKSLCGQRLKEKYGDHVWLIVTGNLVRRRLKDDGDFRREFGKTIARKELLPYEVITPMVQEHMEIGMVADKKFFVWDGFGRDAKQIDTLINWGVLTPTTARILIFMASQGICEQRHDHSVKMKPDKNRSDESHFHKGFQLYTENMPENMVAIEESGNKPEFVNANMNLYSLPEVIFNHTKKIFGTPKKETFPEIRPKDNMAIHHDPRFPHFIGMQNQPSF